MSQIIYPPDPIAAHHPIVLFLAGSIENGIAEDWQSKITDRLAHLPVTFLNPRRPDWDSSWEQSIDHPQFRGQVEWELRGMETSQIIVMNFVPGTISPISLLELGLHAYDGKLIVCCPHGYWRKGNVDVVCKRYGIKQASDLESLVTLIEDQVAVGRKEKNWTRTRSFVLVIIYSLLGVFVAFIVKLLID